MLLLERSFKINIDKTKFRVIIEMFIWAISSVG